VVGVHRVDRIDRIWTGVVQLADWLVRWLIGLDLILLRGSAWTEQVFLDGLGC